MKYIKEYNHYLDPYDEDDWDEIEPDGTFYSYLKINYPDESKWKDIKVINCSDNQLISLKGIENLINLKYLYCAYNQLTSLKGIENLINLKRLICFNNQLESLEGIENLTKLEYLYCYNNNFSNEYEKYLKNYCEKNNITT